jgi:putative protease
MEKRIGAVTHYFGRLGVAVLQLDDGLAVGDTIHIHGHTTDLTQPVVSMEVDHRKLLEVGPGADVALKVEARVRADDVVYKVLEPERSVAGFGAG